MSYAEIQELMLQAEQEGDIEAAEHWQSVLDDWDFDEDEE
jgi:hypothetical protein